MWLSRVSEVRSRISSEFGKFSWMLNLIWRVAELLRLHTPIPSTYAYQSWASMSHALRRLNFSFSAAWDFPAHGMKRRASVPAWRVAPAHLCSSRTSSSWMPSLILIGVLSRMWSKLHQCKIFVFLNPPCWCTPSVQSQWFNHQSVKPQSVLEVLIFSFIVFHICASPNVRRHTSCPNFNFNEESSLSIISFRNALLAASIESEIETPYPVKEPVLSPTLTPTFSDSRRAPSSSYRVERRKRAYGDTSCEKRVFISKHRLLLPPQLRPLPVKKTFNASISIVSRWQVSTETVSSTTTIKLTHFSKAWCMW